MKKKDAGKEAKRESTLNIVMAVALLFLTVVLARGAVVQLRTDHVVSGCVSALGAVLFLCACLLLCHDLWKQYQK